ncbi:MAG: ABC transporter permease [Shewanella sp.]
MTNSAPLAWRLFRRELLQGQLMLIILAIALAVMAVSGLAGVSERLQSAIRTQASEFIAADLTLDSPQAIEPAWLDKAKSLGLSSATNMIFNSMLFHDDKFQLVTVRAVDEHYPLKGEIELTSGNTEQLPQSSEMWFEGRLAGLLGQPQALELGLTKFRLTQEIRRLPDAGFNPFAQSPIVLIAMSDVEATQVVQPGSRVNYLYQFAGDSDALKAFEDYVTPLLNNSQRLSDVTSSESPIAKAINRAEQFLLLASLLGIALACAAIAIAAQRYCERHYDVVAMLKTFGASSQQIRHIFGLHLLLVSLAGIIAGLLLGLMLDNAVSLMLPAELASNSPSWWRPAALGLLTGLISAFMFCVYPLWRLLAIPPLRVFQADLQGLALGNWVHIVLSMLAMGLLGYLYSGSLTLTLSVLAGGGLLGTLLALLGMLMVRLGHGVGIRTSNPLQLALAGLRRRARQNVVQLVGFSSALVLLLTILALRNDLLSEWRSQLPADAPNYFLVNITPEDEARLQQFFTDQQMTLGDVYPVVRARLVAINGESLISAAMAKQGDAGRVGIDRELNLSWQANVPAHNQIIAGAYQQHAGEVSIESKVAERLGIVLGDVLSYRIDNQALDVKVTSIRLVRWESLQPNFFMLFHQQDLAPFAYTAMTSFYLDDSQKDKILALIQEFPTLAIIDVGAMMSQLRGIVDQVSVSLSLVLVLVLAASSLVLFAQTEAGMAVRQRELAVLRTFGGSGRLLKMATALEFALLGAISGVIATIVAEFTLYLLKTQVFELNVIWHPSWWLLAPLFGATLVALLGLWRCRQLLNKNCRQLLTA